MKIVIPEQGGLEEFYFASTCPDHAALAAKGSKAIFGRYVSAMNLRGFSGEINLDHGDLFFIVGKYRMGHQMFPLEPGMLSDLTQRLQNVSAIFDSRDQEGWYKLRNLAAEISWALYGNNVYGAPYLIGQFGGIGYRSGIPTLKLSGGSEVLGDPSNPYKAVDLEMDHYVPLKGANPTYQLQPLNPYRIASLTITQQDALVSALVSPSIGRGFASYKPGDLERITRALSVEAQNASPSQMPNIWFVS
jgi:hypothetical protein